MLGKKNQSEIQKVNKTKHSKKEHILNDRKLGFPDPFNTFFM